MDRERKRKRAAEKEEAASRANNLRIDSKVREAVEEAGAQAASPPPTEEEVDEFFAILKRMRVAVKYFEESSGLNGKSDGDEPQRSTAVEEAVDGVKVGGGKRVVESGGLDLNAVPEAESSLLQ